MTLFIESKGSERCPFGQKKPCVYEKLFNIISHQEYTNQNYSKPRVRNLANHSGLTKSRTVEVNLQPLLH